MQTGERGILIIFEMIMRGLGFGFLSIQVILSTIGLLIPTMFGGIGKLRGRGIGEGGPILIYKFR